ncbi:MAG: NAD-binding protein [Phycisphaerales bacterium]|nr:NAD-binding protein [Planctomycetota bacterium]MCH8508943.1 NAD-binding protein [Phycisphaerales bacterium]
MQTFIAQLIAMIRQRRTRRNLRVLGKFLLVLAGMIVLFTALFQVIMHWEGQSHSLISGLYWVLVTMSTLGFGDIVFESDLGRMYSVVVLISGTVFLLALLPFTFIQFFYAPWIEAQAAARTTRALPEDEKDHVLLTRYDPVTQALIAKLDQFGYSYAVLVPDLVEAQKLHDQNIRVMVGDLDDPETYKSARLARAAMVATTLTDAQNTTVAFTARGVSEGTPVVVTVDDTVSAQILEMAGATAVLRFPDIMGHALARCISGGDAVTHIVARFDNLLIAEANAARTPLVGKTLRENRLSDLDVNVVGVWDRGEFSHATPDTMIGPNTVLMMSGSAEQLQNYDEHFAIYGVSGEPAVIIGSGRIGQATAAALKQRGIDFRIIEQNQRRVTMPEKTIVGNAAEPEILEKAGLGKAPTVVITTHNDDTNLYLTLHCRRLRPDIEIITRCTVDKHVPAMHKAGADFVQSYASIGATSIFNLLQKSRVVTVAQGLDVFRVPVPEELVGKCLADSGIRERSGCTVIGYRNEDGLRANPGAQTVLEKNCEMVVIGDWESRNRYFKEYGER